MNYNALELWDLINADDAFREKRKKKAQEKISKAQSATAASSPQAEQYWTDLEHDPFIDFITEDSSDWNQEDLLATIAANMPEQWGNATNAMAEQETASTRRAVRRKILTPIVREDAKGRKPHMEYHRNTMSLPVYESVQTRFSRNELDEGGFTQDTVASYLQSLERPASTLDQFDDALWWSKRKNVAHDPFRGLFNIIHDNSQSLMDIIDTSLQQIKEGMLDEGLVQERVSFWKGLLHRLDHSLKGLEQEVDTFSNFWTRPRSRSRTLADAVGDRLTNSLRYVEDITRLLHEEMQVVHNQRNIAETESVSKLTELAFIFIPLSFAASLFSMQVNELAGGVPLYSFAIVAIGFVSMAYVVRLAMRNAALRDYRDDIFLHIREDHRLQGSEPIPTRTFLTWVGGRMVKLVTLDHRITRNAVRVPMFSLTLGALLSIPIIVLWRRNIDKGFSTAVTVLLVLLDAVMIGTAFESFGSQSEDWETRKRVTLKRRRKQHMARRHLSRWRSWMNNLDPEIGAT